MHGHEGTVRAATPPHAHRFVISHHAGTAPYTHTIYATTLGLRGCLRIPVPRACITTVCGCHHHPTHSFTHHATQGPARGYRDLPYLDMRPDRGGPPRYNAPHCMHRFTVDRTTAYNAWLARTPATPLYKHHAYTTTLMCHHVPGRLHATRIAGLAHHTHCIYIPGPHHTQTQTHPTYTQTHTARTTHHSPTMHIKHIYHTYTMHTHAHT